MSMNSPHPPTYRFITREEYGFERGRWYGDHQAAKAHNKRRQIHKLARKQRATMRALRNEIKRLRIMLDAL